MLCVPSDSILYSVSIRLFTRSRSTIFVLLVNLENKVGAQIGDILESNLGAWNK
jgi:hypothetical protein